jgi:hypothetical protein
MQRAYTVVMLSQDTKCHIREFGIGDITKRQMGQSAEAQGLDASCVNAFSLNLLN